MPEVLKSHLKEGLRVIVRTPGASDGKAGVVLSEKADKGKVPVRLADGSTVELKRTEMEEDPSPSPPSLKKTAMRKGKKATKIFLVESADKHSRAALARDVEAMGGELVKAEGGDVLSVWCGGDNELVHTKGEQPLYSRRLILDCAVAGELPDHFKYEIRAKLGTKVPSAASRPTYEEPEDRNILAFCEREIERDPGTGFGGTSVWQKAEREKVTGRSWQSMKERFKKVLIVQFNKRMQAKKAGLEKQADTEEIEDFDNDEEGGKKKGTPSPAGRKRKAAEPVVKKEKDEGGGGGGEKIDLVTPPRAKKASRKAVKEEKEEEGKEEADEEEESEAGGGGGSEVSEEEDPVLKERALIVNGEVERLIRETGLSKTVVTHGLIVCGGDFGLAEMYLNMELPKEERELLWDYTDDMILVGQDDMTETLEEKEPTEEEITHIANDNFLDLVRRRGMPTVRERYLWIHAPH